jgi:uncharacterized lipoprotein YehR (DUF1307 family)
MKSVKIFLSVLLMSIIIVSISACGGDSGSVGNTGTGKTTGSLTGSGK